MVNTKPKPMEEVNSLLFGNESQDNKQDESQPIETTERLLKQKGTFFNDSELAPVPYYKKPSVQLIAVLSVAIPFGWMFISAFNSGEPQADPKAQSISEQEKERTGALQKALEQERQKNRDLALENGLNSQKIDVVPVQKTNVPKPLPPPTPRPQPKTTVTRSIAPQTIPVRTSVPVAPKPVAVEPEPEPKPDPMEQWLAQANQGYYVTSSNQSISESYSDTSNYNNPTNPNVTQTYSEVSNYDNSTNSPTEESYSSQSPYASPEESISQI